MDNNIRLVRESEIPELVKVSVDQPLGVLFIAGKGRKLIDSISESVDWSRSKSLVNAAYVKSVEGISQGSVTNFSLKRFSINELVIFANGVLVISTGEMVYYAKDDAELRDILISIYKTVERIADEI